MVVHWTVVMTARSANPDIIAVGFTATYMVVLAAARAQRDGGEVVLQVVRQKIFAMNAQLESSQTKLHEGTQPN